MAKRIRHVRKDVSKLAGPYYVTGNLGSKMPQIKEPVWYDEGDEVFVFADGTLAYDPKVSKSPPLVLTRTQKKRASVRGQLKKELKDFNAFKKATDISPAERRAKMLKASAKVAKLEGKLSKVASPTDKIAQAEREDRKIPRLGRASDLKVVSEYDRKTGEVKFFFDGADAEVAGRMTRAKPKSEAVRVVAPIVREVLAPYTDPDAKAQGERGYWAVPKWEYPQVKRALEGVAGVKMLGAPNLDIARSFKELDERARRVDSRKIEFGTHKPDVGEDTETGKPVPYQEEGVKFLMSRDRALLADDMGLGKTYQAIIAAHNAVPKSEQILVLCPAAVVGSWKKDIGYFMPSAPALIVNSEYFAEHEGKPPTSKSEKIRFVICSYQGATSLQSEAKVAKYLLSRNWGLVILDEAHRLKKPDTLGNQFVSKLKTERMWLLTGTPIANVVVDLYGLLKLVQHPDGSGRRLFGQKYVDSDTASLERLGKALTGTVLRRTKEDVLKRKLPIKVGGLAGSGEGMIMVSLPPDIERALAGAGEEGKVSQERLRHALAVAKVPATWEVAERVVDAGDKVILFSTYTDVLKSFGELCEDAKVLYVYITGETGSIDKSVAVKLFQGDDLEADEEKWAKKHLGQWYLNLLRRVPVDQWDAKDVAIATRKFGKDPAKWPHEIQVVLAQMVAASEGVTLTRADTLLFNDLDYMPTRHEQGEDRIYRKTKPGQPKHSAVFIGYMIADDPNGLDQKILKSLQEKRGNMRTVYSNIGLDARAADKRTREAFVQALRRNPSHAKLRPVANPTMGL